MQFTLQIRKYMQSYMKQYAVAIDNSLSFEEIGYISGL